MILLLNVLMNLQEAALSGKPDDLARRHGICVNLEARLIEWEVRDDAIEQAMDMFKMLCTGWPEYSGDMLHPISTDSGTSVARQYAHANQHGYMWNGRTYYGAARLRLLSWAIETLKEAANG